MIKKIFSTCLDKLKRKINLNWNLNKDINTIKILALLKLLQEMNWLIQMDKSVHLHFCRESHTSMWYM
jgi:molybdenum cofactor biosynthesis enzyme MoaA